MNRLTVQGSLAAALLLGVLAVPAFAGKAGIGWQDTIAAKSGKAKTMAELAKMYDSSSCVECHQEQHDQAQKSIHSRSVFGTARTAMTIMTTIENGLMEEPYSGVKSRKDVKVEHLMGCAKCHLPQLADAEDSVAQELVDTLYGWKDALKKKDKETAKKLEEKLKSVSINCLICHNRNAITHKWQDGYPKAGVVYGSKEGAHDSQKFPKMAVSPIMDQAIQCGQCHGLGPNLELDEPTQCCTSYGSYLWAYKAEVGQENCQDCHMKNSKLGHNIQGYRDAAMTDKAVEFKAEAFGYYWRDGAKIRPRAVVKVEMVNKAGHSIPDG
ncbi:cytochrome C [Geomonas terrae]|uniref:Cytochrome C n=2 Tax=Geomonas terrae TaxID=2562681 RepID=A0A4S1CLI1_9BACT|nr:cytochrome C [Geomonas terrae]